MCTCLYIENRMIKLSWFEMKICMKLECEEEDLATVQLSNVQLLLQYSTLFCKINDFL